MKDVTKLSEKGQIVIPIEMRKALGILGSDVLQVEEAKGVLILKKVSLQSATRGKL